MAIGPDGGIGGKPPPAQAGFVFRSRVLPKLADDHVYDSVNDTENHSLTNYWREGHVHPELLRDIHELVRHYIRGQLLVQLNSAVPPKVEGPTYMWHAERKPMDWFRYGCGALIRQIVRPGEIIWLWPETHITEAAVHDTNWRAENDIDLLLRFQGLRTFRPPHR